MPIAPALLEDWLRERYFTTTYDISSSGVENYTVDEVLSLAHTTAASLGDIVFRDSHSLGGEPLRAALADRHRTDPDSVIATQGSSEAVYLVMHALLKPGDEVVVQAPAYHALVEVAASLGCRIVPWTMRTEHGVVTNHDELLSLIGPHTAMAVVNFPHNPTGATVTEDQQTAIIDACAQHGTWLAWDNAFQHLVYDREPLPEPTHRYPRAISFGTLSKAYGLPGLRVGWALAAPEVLAGCVRRRDYTSLALSPLVEAVATHAVRHADALLAPRLAQATANRAVLADWLTAHADRVRADLPAGGVTAFPELITVPDVTGFADRLDREHGVLVVPGHCFGAPRHIRLGFGGASEELTAGLDRLAALLPDPGPR
ncbi:aminotransferase [Streptomyces spiroverticillatus]|uniref:Aminotransferase n=1 Tax=Streptomyces finlayi TaxID=67296 RepID=A0A919CEQ9_9ACTN|nr:capreomycidine synthase [Streptomyces finlayi]GHA42557.1 aminotransferase [Streptomyces spiroverticillatus]GHD13720.1 aminotransferase [Streptomyces finlayi]